MKSFGEMYDDNTAKSQVVGSKLHDLEQDAFIQVVLHGDMVGVVGPDSSTTPCHVVLSLFPVDPGLTYFDHMKLGQEVAVRKCQFIPIQKLPSGDLFFFSAICINLLG